MSYTDHRNRLLDVMEEDSIAVVYAGMDPHSNEDDYYQLIVNSQFFWLTGLERAGMALVLIRTGGKKEAKLFIDDADPMMIRWTGPMPSKEDAAAVSGMSTGDIRYTSTFRDFIGRTMSRRRIRYAYFDTWKCSCEDLPHYNAVKAMEFMKIYPGVELIDLHNTVAPLRCVKDEEEIGRVKKAIDITRQGLEFVMQNLEEGRYEYQVEADFAYKCRCLGASLRLAFPTIAGAGPNACMMHYVDNSRRLEKDEMILLDLGAKYENYCSDISRTYPASGHFTARQRQFYDIVLKANRAIAAAAKPGITTGDLQKAAERVLGEGLVELGLIEKPEQVGKYYMHGCSHSIGIDCHDASVGEEEVLKPGWIISDEPGLYIDEEGIGIRIEDDLLITEDGAVMLSQDILSDPDEIEAYMASVR